ncbi:MAG: cellulose biosynthesis cyclic di-GMP-binding regulatory protein BcsB [bacterium]|nr:cellulose biosynthesis cyclic di-GMP-binding regulatory protein BcsB [bacterium]
MIFLKKMVYSFIAILLILEISPVSTQTLATGDQKEYFSIQVGSFSEAEKGKAIKIADILKDKGISQVRVEKISNVYTVRAGLYREIKEADKVLGEIKPLYPQALIKSVYYIPERIVYSHLSEIVKTEAQTKISKEQKSAVKEDIKEISERQDMFQVNFDRTISYSIPVFEDEKIFVTPVNTYSLWFELPDGLQFTSPFYLSLYYSYSETLIPGEGAITVFLNDIPVASRRFPSETKQPLPVLWKVDLPVKFLKTGFNEVKLVSRHRSSRELCADSENSANWFRWEPESCMVITRLPVTKLPLSLYPFPYLDKMLKSPVNAEWIVKENFSKEDLSLLLELASYWGYKNPSIPLNIKVQKGLKDRVEGNQIYFAGVELTSGSTGIGKGFIKNILINYDNRNFARLYISGDNSSGFNKAVKSLMTGMPSTSNFEYMEVSLVPDFKFDEPKDTYSRVYFYEIGISDIVLSGAFHQRAQFIVNRPVLSSLGKESYLYLRFRHSDALRPERSILSVSINGIFAGSVKLTEKNRDNGTLLIRIPLNQLTRNAWLVKIDVYHDIGSADCGKKYEEIAWTVIDDTSYLQLKPGRVKGYPYLEYFPYLKKSLSISPQIVNIWLPSNPSEGQLSTAATIAARAGQINRAPIKWNVYMGDSPATENFSKESIILISNPVDVEKLPEKVKQSMHILPLPNHYELKNKTLPLNYSPIENKVIVQASISPFDEKGVLYSILGNEASLYLFNQVLTNKKMLDRFSGGIVFITSLNKIHSFPIVDEWTLRKEIEEENSRYTIPMLLITIVVILLIILLIYTTIRLLIKPKNKNKKQPEEREQQV